MPEINNTILQLMIKNKPLSEISKITGLTREQINTIIQDLKNYGYSVKEKHYCSGDIKYSCKDRPFSNEINRIYTTKEDYVVEVILLADTHFGSTKERIDALEIIYEFALEENINTFIFIGDYLAGLFGRDKKILETGEAQLQHAITNHPFSEKITCFILLGDHDYSVEKFEGLDLASALKESRSDFVPLGYDSALLKIKNDVIGLRHPLPPLDCMELGIKPNFDNCPVVFSGHSHKLRIANGFNKILVNIPSLSDIYISPNEFMPGAMLVKFHFYKGIFSFVDIKHLLVSNRVHVFDVSLSVIRNKKSIKQRLQMEEEAKKLIKK